MQRPVSVAVPQFHAMKKHMRSFCSSLTLMPRVYPCVHGCHAMNCERTLLLHLSKLDTLNTVKFVLELARGLGSERATLLPCRCFSFELCP